MEFPNCSSNATFNCTNQAIGDINSDFKKQTVAKCAKIAAYALIAVVALVGNLLVIIVICRNKNLRRAINFFILNMAISDLFTPTISIPLQLYSLVIDTSPISPPIWPIGGTAGVVLCKLSMFLADSSPIVSILSLVFMTVDRFNAVVFPFKTYLISFKVRMSLLAASWIIAFAYFSPYFYAVKVVTHQGQDHCQLNWEPVFNQSKTMDIYTTTACIVFTIIPFILMSIMYTAVLLILRKQSIALPTSQTASRRRQRNNRNIVLMALAIVVVFAVCWGPYNGFFFMLTIVWRWQIPHDVISTLDYNSFLFVTQFLTYSNAALNPLLYFIFIESYRTALRNLCCGKKSGGRRQQKLNNSTSYLHTLKVNTRNLESSSLVTEGN